MEQEVRGSIPGLAATISEIGYLPLPSRDMDENCLSDVNPQNNQPTNQNNSELLHVTLFHHLEFPHSVTSILLLFFLGGGGIRSLH